MSSTPNHLRTVIRARNYAALRSWQWKRADKLTYPDAYSPIRRGYLDARLAEQRHTARGFLAELGAARLRTAGIVHLDSWRKCSAHK